MEKPNVLMVITHDTGRHLGCYGWGVETPNLDRLAGDGVTFTNFFCTAPQCSPSRASFLTGRYPHSNGLIGLAHRGFRLNSGELLLPALLAREGYSTHLFGFQHESSDPYALGYQNVVKGKSNSCLNVAPLLLEFLSGKPKEPFFAVVGFQETHRPFPEYDGPVDDVPQLPYLPDDDDVRRDLAALYMVVRRVDRKMGEILAALDETGLAENTLVVFTTDHGIAFPGAKATLYDPGIEIALLMRGPGGFESGKRVHALLVNNDLLPTVLDVCGVSVPAQVQGRSVLPLVRDELGRLHDRIFVEQTYHAAYDPLRGLRTERYKYIRSFEERPFWFPPNVDNGLSKEVVRRLGYFDRPRPAEMLFDLEADPVERNNLATDPDYAGLLERMRAALERWMRDTNDPLLKGYVPPHSGAYVTPPDSYNP